MSMLRYQIRQGGNLLTFGPAGIGKTEMAMQACTAEGYDFRYVNLSVLEAPDLLGLPEIVEEEADGRKVKRSDYALPKMLPPRGSLSKPVVLLVDELDKAKPELQNPMLELFQFKSINGNPLDVRACIATGNLPDENAHSQPVSHALTNRCAVYRVTHAYDPWRDWAVEQGINPLVVAFLERNSEFLLQPPPQGDETAYCHPSPRAWVLAARDLDGEPGADVLFQTHLVSGRIGQTAAVKFRVWLDHYRHVEPVIDRLVKEGKHPDLNDSGMTGDRVFVCATSGADAISRACRKHAGKATPEAKKEVHKIAENVSGWLEKLPGEICICAVKSTLNMKLITEFDLVKNQTFMKVYLKIKKAMRDDS
jgi:hypothetical protein